MTGRGGTTVAIFCSEMEIPGGAQRLAFEEADHLARRGFRTVIGALRLDPAVRFSGAYGAVVEVLGGLRRGLRSSRLLDFVGVEVALFRWLRQERPNLVIAMADTDATYLRIPAALTRTPYFTHINGTIFWIPSESSKYALLHRSALKRVLAISPTHADFVPAHRDLSLGQRLRLETSALLHRFGVRGARRRITFSRRMSWEVEVLYGRTADTLKGAFPIALLDQPNAEDPLAPYRRGGPMILNVNRLDPRKRIDLAIRAMPSLLATFPDAVLVIAGEGPEEMHLRATAADLGLAEHVQFVGFVTEQDLPNWLAWADVFVHPNWAEFAIAPFEALARSTPVVWANEMEMDTALAGLGLVFPTRPDAEGFAEAIRAALAAPSPAPGWKDVLADYSWEHYFDMLATMIRAELKR